MTAIGTNGSGENPEEWYATINSDQEELEYPEDNDWEDEDEDGASGAPSSVDLHEANHITSKRRRKLFTVTTGRKSPAVLRVRQSRAKPVEATQKPIITAEKVAAHAKDGSVFVAEYGHAVIHPAILMLKRPLTLLVFLWLLTMVTSLIFFQFRKTVAPYCGFPLVRSWDICQPIESKKTKWADYERLADVQANSFAKIMGETVGNSALSLDIKQAQMATADLAILVRVSDLKAKDVLEGHLLSFNDRARKTGRGLQKLSSKVGGAVDKIMAINSHAMASIEQARADEAGRWSLSRFWNPDGAKQKTQEVITSTFDQAMGVVSANMRSLIIDAEVNLKRLDDLEVSLDVLHEMVATEESTISKEKEEVLARLWTKLGGNKSDVRNFNLNLDLLSNLGEYRKKARAHVVATLQSLEILSEDMEDMRERVAAPELMGPDIPAEVHMKSIQMGLNRLKEGRIKAMELEDAALKRMRGGDEDD